MENIENELSVWVEWMDAGEGRGKNRRNSAFPNPTLKVAEPGDDVMGGEGSGWATYR